MFVAIGLDFGPWDTLEIAMAHRDPIVCKETRSCLRSLGIAMARDLFTRIRTSRVDSLEDLFGEESETSGTSGVPCPLVSRAVTNLGLDGPVVRLWSPPLIASERTFLESAVVLFVELVSWMCSF